MRRLLLCAALLALALPALAAVKTDEVPKYKVASTFNLPGESGWDYLYADAEDRRLYVAHGSEVQVADMDTHKLIGTVPGINGAHGVAVAHAYNHGFATTGRDSSMVMFDLKTLAVLKRLPVTGGRGCDAIVYEPASHTVYSFNASTRNGVGLDGDSGELKNVIDLEGKPEFAAADGRGAIFVNNEDSSWVAGFDAKDKKPRVRWKLAPGETPSGLAYDPVEGLIFSVCENKLMTILDSSTGKLLQTLPIGEGSDGVAFDPEARTAFASCGGSGTMVIAHEDSKKHFVVSQVVDTEKGARTVTVDPKTHDVYTCTAKFGPRPAPTADRPHPWPSIVPGSFHVIVLSATAK
jgi:DNA-binding beta-propeller fold protein YncE